MDVSPDASAGQAGPGVLPAAGGAAFPDSSSEDEFPSLPPLSVLQGSKVPHFTPIVEYR